MSNPRWQRMQELFHQSQALLPEERNALLDRACADDQSLRAAVERLLSADDRAGTFIREPAVDIAALELPDESEAQIGRRVGAYRLASAVGRGGMGAVYLAERDDGAFSQRVAIKLIKRGMDTDQVLARFRAERQILASLDHPNIARLVDGGTTDDGLPYFAMEFIEGQPIDSYAETARLDVEGRLRLFLQVCDAVVYAHGKGVIHRDIKPLNTIVTPAGVPKLLDFGIAKVLRHAPEENTATITGLRLLTPDYASPEQIEGRQATMASDVYSLGVVLFELLTGRSPYRVSSRSPQEVAAAVVTAEPDRPSTMVTQPAERVKVRRTLPTTGSQDPDGADARTLSRRLRGDLDTIVLTALRKEPTRRYASVAQLADDIRCHLDGRPIAARADHTGYRVVKFVHRHRNAALAGTVALVAVASSGWLLSRSQRDAPSLLSTRSLALRDRIVVADFSASVGDERLGVAITDAFRTDLTQSPVIRVMTPRQVRSALTMMREAPDIALNDSIARELALREGVKAIVSGSISQVSGQYTINVLLLAAQTGEALVSVRETARDSTMIVEAVDRASKSLRRRIGESLRDLDDAPPLRQVTTASLPALRLYAEAQRLVLAGDRTAAIDRFEQAVALDSGFATAHLALAFAYGSMGDAGRSWEAGNRALARQERLSFLERGFQVASRAYANEEYDKAIGTYSDVIDRYPENTSALNNLGLAYRDSRRYAQAESAFVRAIRIDSTIANFYFGLHSAQILDSRFAEASATLEELRRRFPTNPVYWTEAMQDAAAQQDWSRASRVAWANIEETRGDSLRLVDPYEALAQIAMARGRLQDAERLWSVHARIARASGSMSRLLHGVLQRGHLLLRYRSDTVGAVALVDSALGATPLDSLRRADRRYHDVARFFLAAGHVDRVGPLLVAAESNDSELHRSNVGERSWTRGILLIAGGDHLRAIDTLRRAAEKVRCTNCVFPDLGRAYERAGRRSEAADAYRRYLTTPWLWRYESDAVELGWVLQRFSHLSVELGDTTTARRTREQLRLLWSEADRAIVR